MQCNFVDLKSLLQCATQFLVGLVVPIIISFSLVLFLLGVFKFVRGAGDAEERTKGKNFMFWGIIAFLLMFCFWAFVSLISNGIFGKGIFIPQL